MKSLQQSLARRACRSPRCTSTTHRPPSPDGVAFTAFNVDRDFGDCVDSFVIADLHKLTPRKRQRYLA
jgi:hypothetical protein